MQLDADAYIYVWHVLISLVERLYDGLPPPRIEQSPRTWGLGPAAPGPGPQARGLASGPHAPGSENLLDFHRGEALHTALN